MDNNNNVVYKSTHVIPCI